MSTVFETVSAVLDRRRVQNQDERQLEQMLTDRYGLSMSTLGALIAIEERPQIMADVAERLGLIPSNMTRIADRLETAEPDPLATRVVPEDNRRATFLQITAAGRNLLARIRSETLQEV